MSVFLLKSSKVSNTHYVALLIQYNKPSIYFVGSLIHYNGLLKDHEVSVNHYDEPLIYYDEPLKYYDEALIHYDEANSLSMNELRVFQNKFLLIILI